MIIIVTRKTPIHPSRPSWDIPPSLFWQHWVQNSQSHLLVVFLFLFWWFLLLLVIWYIPGQRLYFSYSSLCPWWPAQSRCSVCEMKEQIRENKVLEACRDPCNVLAEEARKRASPTIFIHSFPSHCRNSEGGRVKWSLSGLPPWPVPAGALARCQTEPPNTPPSGYFSWPSSPPGNTENWFPLKLCCSHWLLQTKTPFWFLIKSRRGLTWWRLGWASSSVEVNYFLYLNNNCWND